MDGLEGIIKKKTHRKSHAGRKADKKSKKDEHVQELTSKQRNPKAFTFQSVSKGERQFRRKEDIQSKKHHVPQIDRTPLEPPPIVVAVVGPPQVGKSTLIRCLIKSFTKTPLSVIKGPVTLIVGKKRRITFIECNNDINTMIDISKVADLVLVLIDASFGFEMEVFEFLNICQVHGLPKIMGVLTHLDMLKNNKTLKNTKKMLKHRFWTEVYAGAKLFYLSGILHGEYMKNEVKNLGRFISVMKFRPLIWQTTHSYLLADRIEDITSEEIIRQNHKCDRTVSIYGYVRGIPLNKTNSIHIPGCGDSKIQDIYFLPDPCPLPEQIKKRSLVEKERLIYAPFSGVGGIVYDKDAVYVELAGSHSYKTSHSANNELVSNLLDTKDTIESKLERSEMLLFSNTEPIKSGDFDKHTADQPDETNDSESDEEMDTSDGKIVQEEGSSKPPQKYREEMVSSEDGRTRRKVLFDDDLDMCLGNDDVDGSDEEEDIDDNSEEEDKPYASEDDMEEEEETDEKETCVNKKGCTPQPRLSEKDIAIRNKISSALAILDKKEAKESFSDSAFSDESDDEIKENSSNASYDDLMNSSTRTNTASIDQSESDSSEIDDEGDTELNWKSNLAQKAADAFLERQANITNLNKYVYDVNDTWEQNAEKCSNQDEEHELGGLFKVVNLKQKQQLKEKDIMNNEDSSKFILTGTRDWSLPSMRNTIRDCFVTGTWKATEDASELLKLDEMDDDEEVFGDFEDLETGEKHKEDVASDKPKTKVELLEKKRKLKEQFDAEYDDKDGGGNTYYDDLKTQATKQAELNKQQFEGLEDAVRVELEGFRAGLYIRLELANMPCELITNFDPTYPLIVGGLQPGEENIGYVRARVKKHRWYGKILKSGNPVILSMGWRRFQTLPIYSKEEDNLRYRMLKYTPQHVACMAHFWGPITKSGTGFLAVQDVAQREPGFRIIATGTILDANQTTEVTKKLKLTGVPMKIYKKTAFIKDMFNSILEVAKFEGAKIRTVSGIRGQIKKALNKPAGAFRATFEDKILLSDIVFCRTWYRVDIPKLYNPVTSLLMPSEEKCSWTGMKTTGQLKRERGLQNDAQKDSMYTPIQRKPKILQKLKIPKALQKELPYRMKPKNKTPVPKTPRVAVVRNEKEEKVASLMRMLRTNYTQKHSKEKQAMKQRMAVLKAKIQQEEQAKLHRQKIMKKDIFRTLSKADIKEKNKIR